MRFDLTLLGTNSALPAHNRFPSAQVLNVQEKLYLIDCGEGTQVRMIDFNIQRSKINQIFISHLHGDHVYGLIGLLTSYGLMGRKQPLDVFSPEGLEEMILIQLKYSGGGFSYPVRFHVLEPSRHLKIFEDPVVEVYSLPLDHRIPTSGFLFKEKKRKANLRKEKIEEYQIHYTKITKIISGADLELSTGQIIPNVELVYPAPRTRSFAYCSDTRFNEALIPLVRGVDLLYHESTFSEDRKEQAIITKHSTAKEAATIAKEASVGKLILGHYSSRYGDLSVLLEEARAVFPETELGIEGRTFEVFYEPRQR